MLRKLLLIISVLVSLNATQPTYDNLTKLYVATFNRAPDAAGLIWWLNESNLDLEGIAKSFFVQTETQALYPAGTTVRTFIQSVYQNLFNREPDSEGLSYWEDDFNFRGRTRDSFILAMINGAKDNADGMDKTILENKKEAGLYFALYGYNDTNFARTTIQSITDATTTATQAKNSLYDDSGTSTNDACIVDFLYYDNSTYSLCYEGVEKGICEQTRDSDYEAAWYGFPVKGECLSLGYPQNSQDLDSNGYVYYGMSDLYGGTNSSDNEDGTISVDTSVIISKSGGESKIKDMIFEVPANSVNTEVAIKVGKTTSQDDNPVSDEYAITDILDKLQKPITVKIPLKNYPQEGELFFQYIPSKGGYATSAGSTPYIHMFEAKAEGDYAVGDIFNFTNENNRLSLGIWDRIKDALNPADNLKDVYSFIETKAMHREKTADGQFMIYYPVDFAAFDSSALALIEDVVEDGLNSATSKLDKMDFDWKALHKPIPVVLVKETMMAKTTDKAVQTKPTKFVTNKYPMIKVNMSELKRAKNDTKTTDEFRATLGHEFFHTVQNLYDPAWFNDGSSVFLAELSSVWFEYKMSTKPTLYSSDVATAYTSFQNYGLDDKSFGKYSVWTTNKIANLQNLGYGASMFLLYVTIAKQDDKIMYDIWKNYKNGDTTIESIDKSIKTHTSDDLGTMWRRFAMDFNTRFENFPYKNHANWPASSASAILDVSKISTYNKNFVMPPYSAVNVYLGNSSEDKDFDIKVAIERSGGNSFDSDVYIFDAISANQLLHSTLNGDDISFKMSPKPSSRSMVIINSGKEKMDIKLNIEVESKKSTSSATSDSSALDLYYVVDESIDNLTLANKAEWSIDANTAVQVQASTSTSYSSEHENTLDLVYTTEKYTSSKHPMGTFDIVLSNNIVEGTILNSTSKYSDSWCEVQKPYYTIRSINKDPGYVSSDNFKFNANLNENRLTGEYEFIGGSDGRIFIDLNIPLTCQQDDKQYKYKASLEAYYIRFTIP